MTKINGMEIDMLYDPVAAQSVCGKKLWKQIGRSLLNKNFVAYADIEMRTLGISKVKVEAVNCRPKILFL